MNSTASPVAPVSRRNRLIGAGVVLLAVMVALAAGGSSGPLTVPKAIILGAVEGITEFLPISSTGHLLVTQRLLDLGTGAGKKAADTYAVAIQLGAILAVVALYWQRMIQMLRGLFGKDAEGLRLLLRLLTAFAPAALIGVAFEDTIKEHLFGPWPIVIAWAVGGVFLLLWKPQAGSQGITSLTTQQALIIGCTQVLALWPGVSRSLTTIVAALLVGLTMTAAVEFGFLLGLMTLSAATVLDLGKDGRTLIDDYGIRMPLLGAVVAFITAALAAKWLVAYLRRHPLTIFGWYRLGAAAVTVALIAGNVI
jgi:undecaprenyl-diphosphatase